MLVPAPRHLVPALAHVVAGQVQAPEQGGGIHEVERDGAAASPDWAVVEPENIVDLPEVEVAERPVPPVVDLEEVVVARPVRLAGHRPAHAVLGAALHLHHVGHSVVRPAVERLGVEGFSADSLGPRVVSHLLQTERVHAEHDAAAGSNQTSEEAARCDRAGRATRRDRSPALPA